MFIQEKVERNIPDEAKQSFCEGVAQCEVTEMKKLYQGCINLAQFEKQVRSFITYLH